MRVRNSFIWLFLCFASSLCANAWRFDTRYSTLKITDQGTFTVNNPILNWDGTLIRSSDGLITGEQISFVDGLLEDAGNQILLHGIFDPAGTILLQGNDTFNAQPGYILQQVQVSGPDNCLFGQPVFASALTLADASTTLTLGIQSQMNQNIDLNDGTLVLKNDLIFSDNAIITGDGEVHGNSYTVETGGVPFTWTSNINWFTNINLKTCVTFTGSFTFNATQNKIEGNGFVCDLTGGGVLTVSSGSTLTLSNVVIKGLGDGAGFGKIILADSTSKLVLTNVTLLFSDDYTTSEGMVIAKGPTTAVVKDHTWLFDMNSTLSVDCLTLWKDTAGAATCGDITFESASNKVLANDGIIDYITLRCHSIIDALESCCEVNDSRIDVLESEIDTIGGGDTSAVDVLDSRVDLLESAVEVNDSRIDLTESCCEVNDSRIDVLESQIDNIGGDVSAIEALDSRVDILESESDTFDSRIDLVESCCEVNGSEIDVLDSRTDLLESAVEVNDSRIDLTESCCEVNDSRIDVLESQIDNIGGDTSAIDALDSRVDLLESAVEVNDSRLDLAESCCEVNDSRIDVLESESDTFDSRLDVVESEVDTFDSRIDLVESCCEVNGSEIDVLDSRTDLLESAVEVNDSRIDLTESCCEVNDSRIDVLESQIDNITGDTSAIDALDSVNGSIIDVLESKIDSMDSDESRLDNLDSRVDLLESCCEVNGSEVAVLDSRTDLLESCCEVNDSRIDMLESQADTFDSRIDILDSLTDNPFKRLESCCDVNGSKIDDLDSRVDLLESCCEVNDSRVDLLESCCEVNDSRIDVLESESDTFDSRTDLLESAVEVNDSRLDLAESCCEVNDSRIDVLESESDTFDSRIDLVESCCEVSDSRIDTLESEVDVFDSRIDLVESCCDVNGSKIDVIESEIDTIVTQTCIVPVCGDLNFTLDMLPGEGEAVVFEFCKCYESKLNPPSVIFDPAIYGGGGIVELPKGSRLAFCGYGTVDLKDGVEFEFTGTACADMGVQPDWPELLLDECACMTLEAGATAKITGGDDGAGCLNMRKGGCILLDQANSHLIFGEDCKNEIIVHASLGSHITVDNPTALISYQLGVFDLIFENNSSMQISDGTIELNALNGVESPGVIRKWEFLNDSCLVLPGQCGKTLGLLRLAPNDPSHCCVTSDSENVMFNNLEGHVCGHGDLQYIDGEVNSITQIQNNQFCITAPMVEVFMNLSYLLEPGLVPPPDATILALQGTRPDQSKCGRLVAFCPERDGSIVGLAQGDHDIFYDSSDSCGTLDLVRGYDRLGRVFTISNCNESTRTPPAPPLT